MMKRRNVLRYLFMPACFLFTFLDSGPAGATLEPDRAIQTELRRMFEKPPQMEGYPYLNLIETAAKRYNMPVSFILAVVRGESFFDPEARSAKGAVGLMQVMPDTASDYNVPSERLVDPSANIDVGVHYLSDLYRQLKDPYLTLAAYYCGPGGVDKANFTLRSDCDEYVHYIHSHLKKILSGAKTGPQKPEKELRYFVVANFDSFLDAKDFSEFLAQKLPQTPVDLFRHEVVHPDHVRFEYRILVGCGKDENRQRICNDIEKVTGFSLCASSKE